MVVITDISVIESGVLDILKSVTELLPVGNSPVVGKSTTLTEV